MYTIEKCSISNSLVSVVQRLKLGQSIDVCCFSGSKGRGMSCVDEDLFARAAELNSLPLTLSSCGDGFMLSLETQ